MGFPLSLTGAVAAPNITVDRAIERVERALVASSAAAVRRRDSSIDFRGAPWFISGWANVLVPVTRGRVEISASAEGVRITYRVTFTHALAFITLGVILHGFERESERGSRVSARSAISALSSYHQ